MSHGIVPLDAMRRALAEIATPGQAKDVRDKAEALRHYARLAQDRELEISAAEIRVRAERRLGAMLIEFDLTAGRPRKNGSPGEPFSGVTLDELGIDKKLSMRAQQLARVADAEFEGRLAEWRDQETRRAARVMSSLFKAVARPPAPAMAPALPAGKYGAIYADPPWRFETWGSGGMDRAPDNHYPTMDTAAICGLPVADLAADDCALFLWAYSPMLPEALKVIEGWGFAYKAIAFNWIKPRNGLGYWTRQRSEICLLATRGRPQRLNADVDQVMQVPPRAHSAKPDEAHARIERLVGGPYIELFARKARDGWDVWGAEAPVQRADAARRQPSPG